MTPQDEFLIPHDAAHYLHLSVESLRRAAKRGEVRCARLGRLVRFRRSWLDAWAEAQSLSPHASGDRADRPSCQ